MYGIFGFASKTARMAAVTLSILAADILGVASAELPVGESARPGAVERPARRVIEEIIVTAQKKEESLQDVPISMSVMDSEFIRSQGLSDLRDVSLYVPNFQVNFVGLGVEPRMRGFSTDPANKGFEQAVGLVLDGIPYGRGDYFQAGLFDVERIEVLRGPQGYLFGKNATVGLLNLVTKNPTEEYAGAIDFEFGDFERRRFEAAVSGPVIRNLLTFRLAGLVEDMDGIVGNTTQAVVPEANAFFQDTARKALRIKAELPNLAGSNLLLSYEHADSEIQGAIQEVHVMPDNTKAFMRRFDRSADFAFGNFLTSEETPARLTRSIDTLVAHLRYDLGAWGLDALFGYATLDSGTFQGDNSPAKLLTVVNDELSKQLTFETRITSPNLPGLFGMERPSGLGRLFGLGELLDVALGRTDFVAGFFYQRRKLDPIDFVVDIYSFTLGELILLNNNPAQSASLDLIVPSVPPAAEADYFETHRLFFTETSDVVAGFGQINWHFTDGWTLLYGMRLNFDRKSASWDATNIGPTGGPESAIVIGTQISPFTAKETRDEFQFSPKVGVKYDWTEEIGLFATWSRSFRGGGFNTANAESADNTRIYDPESSTSWELGAKMRLFDDSATLNVGLFRMTVTDFQYYTTDPTQILPAPFVANAGELRAQGVETDLTFLATTWLTLRGALGFDDTEFVEFRTGACTLDRPNTDGDGDRRCDLSGGPLEQAPKWNISLTPIVELPLGRVPGIASLPFAPAGLDLTGSLTAQYQDTQFLDLTLDPRNRQDSFFRFGGSVGFADANRGWSIGLHSVNLTDVATAAIGGEGITQCSGCFTRLAEPPRLVFGRFRWVF